MVDVPGHRWIDDGPHQIELRRETSGEDFARYLAAKSQEGLRPHLKGSLLVTSGLIPTHIAAQTLVG